MNQDQIKAEHIDPALKAAGCGMVESGCVLREYRIRRALSMTPDIVFIATR
jgi:hypothetical protein